LRKQKEEERNKAAKEQRKLEKEDVSDDVVW